MMESSLRECWRMLLIGRLMLCLFNTSRKFHSGQQPRPHKIMIDISLGVQVSGHPLCYLNPYTPYPDVKRGPQKGMAEQNELESQVTFDVSPDPLQLQLFDDYNVGDYITIEDDLGNRVNRQISGADIAVQLSGSSPIEVVDLEYRELGV